VRSQQVPAGLALDFPIITLSDESASLNKTDLVHGY
jgi:hypothetical protein